MEAEARWATATATAETATAETEMATAVASRGVEAVALAGRGGEGRGHRPLKQQLIEPVVWVPRAEATKEEVVVEVVEEEVEVAAVEAARAGALDAREEDASISFAEGDGWGHTLRRHHRRLLALARLRPL